MRPAESAESDVTIRASIGAGRVGRLVTLAKPEMRCVRLRMNPTEAAGSKSKSPVRRHLSGSTRRCSRMTSV
jgi:hypothetical protein